MAVDFLLETDMPTLQSPQKYFGYSRKPYDAYFDNGQQPVMPSGYESFGQIGMEERKLQAEQKVNEVLGQLDEIDAYKQNRALEQQYAPQMQQLRKEELLNKFSAIGRVARTRQAEQEAGMIDPSHPDAPRLFWELSKKSPEHQVAAQKMLNLAQDTYGQDFGGREDEQLRTETEDYLTGLSPEIKERVAASGVRGVRAAASLAKRFEDDQQLRYDASLAGVEDFKDLEGKDGLLNPAKTAAKIGVIKRTMTPEKAMGELGRIGRDLVGLYNARQKAQDEDNKDGVAVINDQIAIANQRHNYFAPIAGVKPKGTSTTPDSKAPVEPEKKAATLRSKYGY